VGTVWLNNAATAFPRPPEVIEAVHRALVEPPVEPGRSTGGADPTVPCRRRLAELLGVDDPCRVALLPSATHALNTVLAGLLDAGGHVVASTLEHNAVLRPLAHRVRDRGLRVSWVEPGDDGRIDAVDFAALLRPQTRLAVLLHASNVTGAVQPVEAVAARCAEAGVPLLVDASQSAGCIPLEHRRLPGRVFLVAAGHKGLLGPPGVGVLVLPNDRLPQWMVGGTGVRSEAQFHPPELPLRHEAGTPNLPAVEGLAAGVAWVAAEGVETLGRRRAAAVRFLREALAAVPGVRTVPAQDADGRAGILSFVVDGRPPEEFAFLLRSAFGIELRAGLHCAPGAHRRLGTLPLGTLRVGVGPFTTREDLEALVDAVAQAVQV